MADSIRASVAGVQKFVDSIEALTERIDLAAKRIVEQATIAVADAAKRQFDGDTSRPPTQPKPTLRTGNLRNSIRRGEAERVEMGHWKASVGPTIKYGRRVELGGTSQHSIAFGRQTGKVWTVTTRPFPYLEPGLQEALPEIKLIYEREWKRALSG